MSESANTRENLQNLPSIFEINAAETLDNLIYPALSKICGTFGLNANFKLCSGLQIRGEPAPLITWLLQYVYLRNRGASFGESFYGLRRSRHDGVDAGLTPAQRLASTTLLALLPYVERKLKTRAQQHEDTSSWEKYLLKAVHVHNAWKAIQTFLYLIKYAGSHSPALRALGLGLRYPKTPESAGKTDIFLKSLEVLAFFLQFVQWWYSNDQRRKIGGSLTNPEPPESKLVYEQSQHAVPAQGKCPVCLLTLQTPTVCSISGFVFCWKCIMNELRAHGKCPVTGYAFTIEDLVRIYETT